MPQILVVDAPGPARDALVYALEERGWSAIGTDQANELRADESDETLLGIIVGLGGERLREAIDALRTARHVPLVVLVEPGNFRAIMHALAWGADEILAYDRPAEELLSGLKAALSAAPGTDAREPRETIEVVLDGQPQHVQVSTERLLGLLAQVCADAGRLHQRYDVELAHRRRVETALMNSEAFYESLVETLPLALFRKDPQGRIQFANRLLCTALRRPLAEVIGKTDYDFFPEELAEKYRADDRRVLETREDFETIEEFQTPSGERRFTHVMKTPAYDATGQIIGIQGVFSDVTDRMRAEAALEQERSLLDSLMQGSPDNIYFKDAEGRYLRINPAKAKSSGLDDPRDAIGKSDADFFSSEHAAAAERDEQAVMHSGVPVIGKEELLQYPDGRRRWVSTTKLPLHDREGKVIGTFGVSRDITPTKQAQAALEEAAAAAEAANRAKSDFLANMSHEIRTPLNAILGMTELVLDSPLTPVQRDYLKLVYESGESLLTVINDILDFSKIEAGKMTLERVSFDLREFLGDVLKSLGLRAARKGLELLADVAPGAPAVVSCDPHRLRQVLVNLIGNAIKFTEQGEIVLRMQDWSSTPDSTLLHFEVTDTGIGIPADKFPSIFQAFEQADSTTTRKYGGTGLGLAICARLVELMEGRIWIESTVGTGSTFHFTVRVTVSTTAPDKPRPLHPGLLQGMRVLVVDDNSTNRRILAEMLSNWGMVPILAASATEALTLLAENETEENGFALLLTDVQMPELSGFDLVRRARVETLFAKGVVMMLTSGDRANDLDTCRELGVSTYLIKPVKQSELFDAILQTLGAAETDSWQIAAQSQPREPNRPLRVLLAEDSPINQRLAIGLLERWGHSVTVANDGREAVVLALSASPFDVVLMDIQMPEQDGLDATREIRQAEAATGRHLPIIAMTAHALQGDRERCLAAGMDDYVSKPIRSDILFQALERVGIAVHPRDPSDVMVDPEPEVAPALPDAPQVQLDWKRALNATAGDRDLLRDLATTFLQEAPVLIDQAQAALLSHDQKACSRALHTLKSALGTMGATAAARFTQSLEADCRAGTPPTTDAVSELGLQVSAISAALHTALAAWPPI